jgi:hypothetical protein
VTTSCDVLFPKTPTGAAAPPWTYEVVASPGAVDLSITATFPKGSDRHMVVADRADTFVVGVEVAQHNKNDKDRPWREVRREGSEWLIPECTDGCRIRYRYLLADGAGAWGDIALGRRDGATTFAPPSTWLLRPMHAPAGTRVRFHVTTGPGESFVSGVFAAPDTPPSAEIYEARVGDLIQLPYSAFGPLRLREVANGTATVALLPGELSEGDVLAWTESSLAAVRGFYGRPPVPHVLILVRPTPGDDVGFGMTRGYSGASIVVAVGSQAGREQLRRDWVLVHELVHTALPDLPEEQHWLEEGLATYVEPLARFRQGALSAEDVWTEWEGRMKQGEPEAGDQGLDVTHTWGRTYWGGALFCLAVDVEIRARTNGKSSLEAVLRAIVAEGGNIATSWTIERIIQLAQRVTGTNVFGETYQKMAKDPTPVDLPTLWRKLGVIGHDQGPVTFDDEAELAFVRLGMTPPRTL